MTAPHPEPPPGRATVGGRARTVGRSALAMAGAGLALGGALRVSQVQLLQPFLALLFAVPVLWPRATLARWSNQLDG